MTNQKLFITTINNIYKKKKYFLIYLILFIGVLIPTFSNYSTYNFWYRLYSIITNPYVNTCFFISTGLNIIYIIKETSKNYYILNRTPSYKKMIINNTKLISISTTYLFLITIILSIAGALLFSFANISSINRPLYNINIIYYIILYIIRYILFSNIINNIIFFLLALTNQYISLLIVLLNSSIFLFLTNKTNITHFYNLPLIPHYYFNQTPYQTFLLEIICSLEELLILLLVAAIIYKIITKKKRDIIWNYNTIF